MNGGLQINVNVLRVARLFLSNPGKNRCGRDIAKALGLKRSTAYGVLWKLSEVQWLSSSEHRLQADGIPGNPSRRLYRMTPLGVAAASEIFVKLQMAST